MGDNILQTDRILIARPRLHSMQQGKNWASFRPSVDYVVAVVYNIEVGRVYCRSMVLFITLAEPSFQSAMI